MVNAERRIISLKPYCGYCRDVDSGLCADLYEEARGFTLALTFPNGEVHEKVSLDCDLREALREGETRFEVFVNDFGDVSKGLLAALA